jgi:hypothetical protein
MVRASPVLQLARVILAPDDTAWRGPGVPSNLLPLPKHLVEKALNADALGS